MMMNRAKFLQNGKSGYVLKQQNEKLKVLIFKILS